jgi:hypothetical protein
MSDAPPPDAFAAMLAFGGHPLTPERAAAVAAAQTAMWPGLLAMRAVSLSLVDAIEPGHAVARLHGEASP